MILRVEDSRKLLVKVVRAGTTFGVEEFSRSFRVFL
jgi:hypothetical protein